MTNPADAVHQWSITRLAPHAKNSRTHSKDQVGKIAESIQRFGWTVPVLVDEDGVIIAGHGRVLAAAQLELQSVPVVIARGWTDDQKRAYLIADNRLTALGGWDDELLLSEIESLRQAGWAYEALAYDVDDVLSIKEAMGRQGDDGDRQDIYSKRINPPVYEVKGVRPPLPLLVDRTRTIKLLSEIDASAIDEDIKQFLRWAAERHSMFNFELIAEYYAHAPAEVQDLMERSALVIIDYRKAIEYGFAELVQNLAHLAYEEQSDE